MSNVNVLKADQSVLTLNAKRPSTWKPITFMAVLIEVANYEGGVRYYINIAGH